MIAARVDEFGKPAWIGLLIVSFFVCWPLGLVLLGFLIGSGRMGCWKNSADPQRWNRQIDRMQNRVDRMQAAAERFWGPRPATATATGPSSGNRAFDEYREDTLRRLEEEQREFLDFLQRLRHAKDKAEFDQFMAERRRPEPGAQA